MVFPRCWGGIWHPEEILSQVYSKVQASTIRDERRRSEAEHSVNELANDGSISHLYQM